MKFQSIVVTLFFTFLFSTCYAQDIEDNIKKIQDAGKRVAVAESNFSQCLWTQEDSLCQMDFLKAAKDPYERFEVANMLYPMDPKQSMALHRKSYEDNPKEWFFIVEYAIELQRIGKYDQAIPLYEQCLKKTPDNFRLNVWLSECYLNTGEINKSIVHWNTSNHASHHTSIDQAIWSVHGYSGQVKLRSSLMRNIKQSRNAYELMFLDWNWEQDWWNIGPDRSYTYNDLELIKKTFGAQSKEYTQLTVYNRVKILAAQENKGDSIKTILEKNKLVLGSYPLPPNGKVTSDLLRIAFLNGILDEQQFFKTRGTEILKMADTYKDIELLNIYAYLEGEVNGHVSEDTDKKGWKEYQDERFAMSYFIGLADKNRYDSPELAQALQDFPESAALYWVKLNCAKIEGKPLRAELIEEIKREFKSLNSTAERSSYALKNYFYMLASEK